MNIETRIDADYRPSDDEEFMCDRQKEYFRKKLLDWKASILEGSKETVNELKEGDAQHPLISPTGPRRKPTAPSSCAPATANAS